MGSAPLRTRCPSCAAEVGPEQRFCANCGESLHDRDRGAPLARRAERRLVSVLFVDLENFTGIAESLDPEEVRSLQERYFAAAQAAIGRYDGTLEKFIGDAVMAFWGAPQAHEDDARRAVLAGLEVVAAVRGLRVRRRRLTARAAVATGEAAVTYGGEGLGMVAGDLVNTAARLQQAAPRGGVLVDDTTRRVAIGALQFAAAGPARLKGKRRAMATWLAQPPAEPREASAGVHRGPFVGREEELNSLLDAQQATLAGRSGLLTVIGIAGIGKSRLAWEFEQRLAAQPAPPLILGAQAAPYGEGIGFAPLAHIVRRLAGLPAGPGRRVSSRRALAQALSAAGFVAAERDWLEPRLRALLEPQPTPSHGREELFAAWRQYIERHAAGRPLVLVLEDVQWADPALLDFVEHLVGWARQASLLVVALARPELLDDRPGWPSTTAAAGEVRLGPLTDDQLAQILTALVPQIPRPTLRSIVAQAGGVPLYGVEVARMLADRRAMDSTTIPETLHSLVAARIDTLPVADRRLLLSASILGQQFSAQALAAVTTTRLRDADGTTRLAEGVETLVERQLLTDIDDRPADPRRGRPSRPRRLAFVQQVVHEVAYRTLTRRERRELHLAAADYYHGPSGEEHAEPLAEHLYNAYRADPAHERAGDISRRALPALRLAAARATALYSPGRALTHLQRALELADYEALDALLPAAAEAARSAARFDVAEDYFQQLVRWHESRGRSAQAAHARAQLASMLLATERHAAALADLEAALGELTDLDHDPAGLALAGQLARGRMLVGDDEGGRQWARRALDGARRLDQPATAVDALITLGTAEVHLGRTKAGLTRLRRAVDEAHALGLLSAEFRARNNLAWQLVLDDPHATLETAQAGLQLAIRLGVTDMALQLSEVTSTVAVDTGDWDLALSILDDVRDRHQAVAHRVQFVTTEVILRCLRGEPEAADRVADEILPLDAAIDRQVRAGFERALAWRSFVRADFSEAARLADGAATGLLWADEVAALTLAGRAGVWQGDGAVVARALAALERIGPRGRLTEASLQTIAAGSAALERQSDAGRGYAEAIAAWRRLRLPLHLGLCLADRARALGTSDAEAERILGGLGATGLVRLLGTPRRG